MIHERLLTAAPGQRTVEAGKIATLVINDVDTILESYNWVYQIYSVPVVVSFYIGIIVWKFGKIGLLISGLSLLILVFVFVFNRIIINKTKERVALTDIRSARVSEFVQKIRHIKMVGLEPYLEPEIWNSRNEECASLQEVFFRRALFESILEGFPTLVVVVSMFLQYQIYGSW